MTREPDTGTERGERPRRRRLWPWILLGLVGLTLAAVLLTSIGVHSVASRRWADLEERQSVLLARLRADSGERTPLPSGESTVGNAWDEYEAAVAGLALLPEADRRAVSEVLRPSRGTSITPETLKKAGDALAAAEPQLERFRNGARCRVAQYEIDWWRGMSSKVPSYPGLRGGEDLLAFSARRKREGGDLDGAVEDIATGLQLARDVARVPTVLAFLIGISMSSTALDEAREVATAPGLSADQARRLEDLLRRGEQSLPLLADALEGEQALINETLRQTLEGKGPDDFFPRRGLQVMLWRQGFSIRIAAAGVDEAYSRTIADMRTVEDRPWPEAVVVHERNQGDTDNFLLNLVRISLSGADRNLRACRARFSLVRAVLLERAGPGASGIPVDPFTQQPLRRREDGTKTVFWSCWIDGDDGGLGTWHPENFSDRQDLVIEYLKR